MLFLACHTAYLQVWHAKMLLQMILSNFDGGWIIIMGYPNSIFFGQAMHFAGSRGVMLGFPFPFEKHSEQSIYCFFVTARASLGLTTKSISLSSWQMPLPCTNPSLCTWPPKYLIGLHYATGWAACF